jgi:hypothetical protein
MPADSNRPGPPSETGPQPSELLELADALMDRARTLASQSDQLIAALDEVARRLLASGQGVETSPLRTPLSLLRQPPPGPEYEDASVPATDNGTPAPTGNSRPALGSAGARMVITKMALAGSSHEEIAQQLERELGMEDAGAILKEMGL